MAWHNSFYFGFFLSSKLSIHSTQSQLKNQKKWAWMVFKKMLQFCFNETTNLVLAIKFLAPNLFYFFFARHRRRLTSWAFSSTWWGSWQRGSPTSRGPTPGRWFRRPRRDPPDTRSESGSSRSCPARRRRCPRQESRGKQCCSRATW